MSKKSTELNWELLEKAEAQQESLQARLKEAFRQQYPEEYRRRFPEEFQGEQTGIAPAEKILKPPEQLVPIQLIVWPDMPKKDEGFTVVHAMIMVLIVIFLVPLAGIMIVIGAMVPAATVALAIAILAYTAGRLKNRIQSP